jgi:hypothetical protein
MDGLEPNKTTVKKNMGFFNFNLSSPCTF